MLNRKPELLVPAGSLEVLKTAVRYGADAVYIGGEAYSLRAKAKNFTSEEMAEGIAYAHENGVKVYVTANIIAHDSDLEGVREYFSDLAKIKPDAVLIADPGVFAVEREICTEIPVHISTQANNTNSATFRFWHSLGAERAVCARELTLDEIAAIREQIPDDMEIECFVHGAMCISYSGRCLLSAYMTGRSANKGECTHPCRWKYAVVEEQRPGEYFPVEENERGTFIFNSKDLCMIGHIPELVGAGIGSFKIEGRMKTALYVATVARTYRMAIDDYFESPEKYNENLPLYMREIGKCTYRQFTTGFYFGDPKSEAQIYENSTYVVESRFLGIIEEVTEDGKIRLTQKNKFCVGDVIEVMKPDGGNIEAAVRAIESTDGISQESAPHACQVVYVTLDAKGGEKDYSVGDILRADA
ncbi:MAG: U32 family peptidase [Lachnospiraceae bacterium]|nr:U32 family peptidase [Lachnospiraceae bacterium]